MILDKINESAKKAFGNDIKVLVARAVTFGHDDNLIFVSGKRHAEAAASIAKFARDACVELCTSPDFEGSSYTYTSVQYRFAA